MFKIRKSLVRSERLKKSPKKAQNIDTQNFYLARFSTDSKLYRARILGKYDDKQMANVWFIDYGNSEMVKYDE